MDCYLVYNKGVKINEINGRLKKMADKQSINNLERSSKNRNIYVDNTYEKKSLDEAKRRAESDAFDPESVIYARIVNKHQFHKCIIPMYDWHTGGQGSKLSRQQRVVQWAVGLNNAVMFGGGDGLDNANLLGATNPNTSKISPDSQKDVNEDCIRPAAEKGIIAFMLGGNHDSLNGARNRASNADFAKDIAKRLEIKYGLYNALLSVELPFKVNKKRIITADCNMFATHGSGGASSKAGAVDTAFKKGAISMRNSDFNKKIIHLMFSGHHHAGSGGVVSVPFNLYDDYGKYMGTQNVNVRVESCSALQGANSFTETESMERSSTNVYAYDICWELAKAKKNEEPELKLKVTSFPILRRDSEDYTQYADMYAKKHRNKLGLEKQIRNEFKNKSVEEVVEALESK